MLESVGVKKYSDLLRFSPIWSDTAGDEKQKDTKERKERPQTVDRRPLTASCHQSYQRSPNVTGDAPDGHGMRMAPMAKRYTPLGVKDPCHP